MIPLLRSLFEHLAWADSTILGNVSESAAGREDEQIRKLLHHIVSVQRFFLFLLLNRPYEYDREGTVPTNLEDFEPLFREAHQTAFDYLDQVGEADLGREFEMPRRKEFRRTGRDLLVQVVMHSEHHRAQVAMRLRALGGAPAITDYILWAGQHGAGTGA